MPYQCGVCKKTFDAMTADGLCPNPACYGEPLKYVVSAAPGQPAVAGETAASQGKIEDIGLCVLVCDASYSMNDAAFADNPAVKLRLVANAVRRAIVELTQIGRPETAYIAIVAFGGRAELIRDRAGKPFLKSVAEIKRDLDNDIGDYLFDTFDRDGANVNRGYTDISAGLQLARELYDASLKGDLSRWGVSAPVTVRQHDIFIPTEKKQARVPNIRVLIYSDGGHNPSQQKPLNNPFATLQPSVLMTAFIGDESTDEQLKQGAEQMKSLANKCPVHQQTGFFLINSVERYAVLRGLFRMASGASGFCPQCLRESGFLREAGS
jgi:hypothetical protein